MANPVRVSALDGHYQTGHLGEDGETGVRLKIIPDLMLQQIAAWPDTLNDVAATAAASAGVETAPGPGTAVEGSSGALLRIEPLKWWIMGCAAPALSPELGTTLDISHSRTHILISGAQASTLLNRHLPLDLRGSAFPSGTVASTAFHHCGITLWYSEAGYNIFLPRGFALSFWELLLESAAQFGAEIV